MRGISRLNNRTMHALRKDRIYEAVMIDLYLIGALEKEVAEKLTGHEISEYLRNPLADDSSSTT